MTIGRPALCTHTAGAANVPRHSSLRGRRGLWQDNEVRRGVARGGGGGGGGRGGAVDGPPPPPRLLIGGFAASVGSARNSDGASAALPSSPLLVQSPAPDGSLSPPPPPPPPPPPCSSAVPEPMDAEAAYHAAAVAHPVALRGPARFPTARFPRPLASNSGSRVDSAPQLFRCLCPQLRHPWIPPPAVGSHTQRRCGKEAPCTEEAADAGASAWAVARRDSAAAGDIQAGPPPPLSL
ncbi:WAS/WASL-interacting protein family member 3-like [Schistocerca gregaria]|uniref:WAS/WASL-interacting protein family member 3-like n=1 Tax=Schistocerca gregaria TaxID=7010 RepID=UPI00211E1053|nr:WAS/WASL-interacting protein family member 3-like [Schistocerca gregaria]